MGKQDQEPITPSTLLPSRPPCVGLGPTIHMALPAGVAQEPPGVGCIASPSQYGGQAEHSEEDSLSATTGCWDAWAYGRDSLSAICKVVGDVAKNHRHKVRNTERARTARRAEDSWGQVTLLRSYM